MYKREYGEIHGAFGYEVYIDRERKRVMAKIFVYENVIKITGDYDTIMRKIRELKETINKLEELLDISST